MWSAQLVLLALGFVGAERPLLDQFGIETGEQPTVNYHTNVPNIFIAGDARRGQSLIVWAIQGCRAAAREVDRCLMGETDLP
ncbi:MAG: hypothetical protein GY803_17765 [Chloroflexi bacterium]|nr:hypothetical protein [Chloroflexota bacterium]